MVNGDTVNGTINESSFDLRRLFKSQSWDEGPVNNSSFLRGSYSNINGEIVHK